MGYFWNVIANKKWTTATKFLVLWLPLGTVFSLMGLVVWFLVRDYGLTGGEWVFCFMGYPALFAWFGLMVYAYNRDLRDSQDV